MQKAGQIVAKPLVRAAEGRLSQGSEIVELSCFEALVVDAQRAADRRRRVDDDDRGAAGVRSRC